MQVLIPTGRRIHDLVVDTRTKINVRPYCLSVERSKRFGVYFIFNSMEQGTPSIRWRRSTLPTILITASSCGSDPASRITFYIQDEALGPMVMCVDSFLPFQTRYRTFSAMCTEFIRSPKRLWLDAPTCIGTG